MPRTSHKKYYEQNKEKIKEKRRLRYQEKKRLRQEQSTGALIQPTYFKEDHTKQNLFCFPGVEKNHMNKIKTANNNIDYFEVCKILFLSAITAAVVLLFYFQTLPLYKASLFHDPIFAAIGSLTILFGFAAAKAVRRSSLTNLLCVFVLFYEFAFVYYGSSQNETLLKNNLYEQKLSTDESLKVLEANMKMSQTTYNSKLAQFEDPRSKVHENSWFKKVHLQPALVSWKKATDHYKQRKSALVATKSNEAVLHLKIAYRLLLVLFCMMVSHFFVKELLGFLRAHKNVIRVFSQQGRGVLRSTQT